MLYVYNPLCAHCRWVCAAIMDNSFTGRLIFLITDDQLVNNMIK